MGQQRPCVMLHNIITNDQPYVDDQSGSYQKPYTLLYKLAMNDGSDRMLELVERLTKALAELSMLATTVQIPEPQKLSLRDQLDQLDVLLEQEQLVIQSPISITQVPVFDAADLAKTVQTGKSDEQALRKVMLSTDIPLHWSTIYKRIYPMLKDHLRPQDELPQAGHPGLSRWQYRLSWQMQLLRNEGIVRSVGDGYWMRTDPAAPKLQTVLFDD
jgi:hypothetical protein